MHAVAFLTAEQVAERLAVGYKTVLRWSTEGWLPAVNIAPPGSPRPMWRYDEDELAEWERERHNQRGKQ
jgi:excisionase family DNA binding protein